MAAPHSAPWGPAASGAVLEKWVSNLNVSTESLSTSHVTLI